MRDLVLMNYLTRWRIGSSYSSGLKAAIHFGDIVFNPKIISNCFIQSCFIKNAYNERNIAKIFDEGLIFHGRI